MQLISDYIILIHLWLISFLVIGVSLFLFKKISLKDVTTKDKRDTTLFQSFVFIFIIVSSLESSFDMIPHIHEKMLNNKIEYYLNDGFMKIDEKSLAYCHIENSVIYLDSKGKKTDKNNNVITLCI